MPKELTHWINAEKTRTLIEEGPVKDAVNRHIHLYYLGAVVHDSPFYAMAVKNAESFALIADMLHGVDGTDTFQPFRSFVTSFGNEPPAEALSFICGAFTHYSLDVAFHPLVNYFSGKYPKSNHDKWLISQARHRDFESLLDLYMCGKEANLPSSTGGRQKKLGAHLENCGRFSRTLRGISAGEGAVIDLVSRFYGSDERSLPLFLVLKRHGLIQRQFYNRALGFLLCCARRVAGGAIAAVAASFYPAVLGARALHSPEQTFPFFASAVSYIHPNTGEPLHRSVGELLTGAAKTAADMINGYQSALRSGNGEEYLSGKRGLSLDYGCDAVRHPKPLHFDIDTPVYALCRSPVDRA